MPVYLSYLFNLFLDRGGKIVRGSVQHIAQVLESSTHIFEGAGQDDLPVDALIVCVGLGARMLGGVEDKDVYPIRGQTILLHAPWIRFGRAVESDIGAFTYVIPRRSGDVGISLRWCVGLL